LRKNLTKYRGKNNEENDSRRLLLVGSEIAPNSKMGM